MRVLVYLLCSLAIVKIFIDLPPEGELFASYSVFIENAIFLIIITMVLRTYLKQREGRRELLQRKVNELNQTLSDIK
jgi:hypothetical protein